MKIYLLSIFISICICRFPLHFEARNLDSLRSQKSNESLPDTFRLQAMEVLTWEGYVYSQPGSAFYYAELLWGCPEMYFVNPISEI